MNRTYATALVFSSLLLSGAVLAADESSLSLQMQSASLGCRGGNAQDCAIASLSDLELSLIRLQRELQIDSLSPQQLDRVRALAQGVRLRIAEITHAAKSQPTEARIPGMTASACRNVWIALFVPPLL